MPGTPTVEPNKLTVFTVVLLEHAGRYMLLRRSEAMRWNPGRWTGVGGRVEADELGDLRARGAARAVRGDRDRRGGRGPFRLPARAAAHLADAALDSPASLLHRIHRLRRAAAVPGGHARLVHPVEFATLDVIDSTRPVLPLLVVDMARDPFGLEPPQLGVAPVVDGVPREIRWV
jgi:8-oxo-dGTP diphosphatase